MYEYVTLKLDAIRWTHPLDMIDRMKNLLRKMI